MCLEAELDGSGENRSSVCLSTKLTGINGPGSQPFSTLMQNSCQAMGQKQDTLTDISNRRLRTIPQRPHTVHQASCGDAKMELAGVANLIHILRRGHLGKLFVSKRTLELFLLKHVPTSFPAPPPPHLIGIPISKSLLL